MSDVISRDEIDRIVACSTNVDFQRDDSTFFALTSFDAEIKEHDPLGRQKTSQRGLLRQLEDFLSARIIVLKPDAFVPVHILEANDDYFFTEECEFLIPEVVWRRNNSNYRLALAKKELEPQRHNFFKVSFETSSCVLKEDTFVEFFYKTHGSERLKIDSFDRCNGIGVMTCKKMPLEVFEKFLEKFLEYSDLREQNTEK